MLLPDTERVFNSSRQTQHILARVQKIGPKLDELCQQLFAQRGREAQTSMWGIVGLHPRYLACILAQGATAALARGIHSYKAVRSLAEQFLGQAIAQLEGQQLPLPLSHLTQQHELIRNPGEYAAFFDLSTSTVPGAHRAEWRSPHRWPHTRDAARTWRWIRCVRYAYVLP